MKLLDRISMIVGWSFLIGAGAILARPSGPVGREFNEWRQAMTVKRIVNDRWSDLSSDGALLGADTASAIIVEFIDYRCAFCRVFDETATAFVRDYPSAGIRVRQVPRPGDLASREAAISAICANEQDQFREMHSFLLTDDSWVNSRDWDRIGADVGIRDLDAFASCRYSDAVRNALSVDSLWAVDLYLNGTPTLVSKRGGVHLGIADVSQMLDWLNLTAHSTR